MKVDQHLWSIEKLLGLKDEIVLNPAYQRGAAWKDNRRVLLIDSILRNMDVPKIYLRKLGKGNLYSYEAVDGQQRLRAIWDFLSPQDANDKLKGFALTTPDALPPIHGIEVAGKRFDKLSKTMRERILAFKVGVGEIVESTNDEITVLFARLQMGMPLNPAELRNADLGPMRNLIQWLATSHEFFADTRIKDERTRHFDFASYAFAIGATSGTRDMKSTDLRDLQREYNGRPPEDLTDLSSKVGEALNVLAEIDQLTRYRIIRKWIFVDLLLHIMKLQGAGKAIDVNRFAASYDAFEERRQQYTSEPDLLLNARRKDAAPNDRALYDYIYAFRTEGAKSANLLQRNKAITKFIRNVEVR